MTVKEAGKKGGQAVKQKYGPEFYSRIGKKGGETVAAVSFWDLDCRGLKAGRKALF